jgi:hypothetical protein
MVKKKYRDQANFIRYSFATGFLLLLSYAQAEPPYWGTVFDFPDTITEQTPSQLSTLTYAGQDTRTMFDRRTASFEEYRAFLFEAEYEDDLRIEIQVNPEFGSVDAAEEVAQFYAEEIGRLPRSLRKDVETSWIHQGSHSWGGGNNNILIHTGDIGQDYVVRGVHEEALAHEGVHTSLDAAYAASPRWMAAQQADPTFISSYARDFPQREDLAESVVPWLALRCASDRTNPADLAIIRATMPNRIAYLDAVSLDLEPLDCFKPIAPVRGSLSGSWYDRARSGEGFVFEFGSNATSPVAVVYWFTHKDGEPYWLIGTTEYDPGDFEKSGLLEFDMLEISGTGFGAQFNPEELTQTERGRLSFVLEDCDEAVASWVSEDESGELGTRELAYQLERITLGLDGLGCDDTRSMTEVAPLTQKAPFLRGELSGSWFDSIRSGEGFVFEFGRNPDSAVSTVYWFTHREGKPYWLLGSGKYVPEQQLLNFELLSVSGTGFGESFDPNEVNISTWGEASFGFEACNEGSAVWSNEQGEMGEFDLRRITSALDGAPCIRVDR